MSLNVKCELRGLLSESAPLKAINISTLVHQHPVLVLGHPHKALLSLIVSSWKRLKSASNLNLEIPLPALIIGVVIAYTQLKLNFGKGALPAYTIGFITSSLALNGK
jgi:hypothetical protein